MKIAVFPCLGLGDGLISMVLSNQLVKAGHTVETFHPILPKMRSLFPDLKLFEREAFELKPDYDQLIFFYEKLDWMQDLLKEALSKYPEKVKILNPIATCNRDYPYWEEGKFDGRDPFLENLIRYMQREYGIVPNKDNGIVLPEHIVKGEFAKRVVLHPTSSRKGKNWSKEKFLKLADRLERNGYEPVFILTKEEKKSWPEVEAPEFSNLEQVAEFVASSGFMIGNDSGIGHLASCLGVPTLTICRSRLSAHFWRPAWEKGKVIVPPRWIPNIKGLRLRDQKWQKFVSVSKVYVEFVQFSKK